MSISFIYIFFRFFYCIFLFFRHWYYDSLVWYIRVIRSVFRGLDRHLAFWVTIRYYFQPLYQDYSAIGYLLGPIFRTGRLLIGVIVYGALVPLILLLYIFWAAIPLLLIAGIIFS